MHKHVEHEPKQEWKPLWIVYVTANIHTSAHCAHSAYSFWFQLQLWVQPKVLQSGYLVLIISYELVFIDKEPPQEVNKNVLYSLVYRPLFGFRTALILCGIDSTSCWKPGGALSCWKQQSESRERCGHKGMGMVGNNAQVSCGVYTILNWD